MDRSSAINSRGKLQHVRRIVEMPTLAAVIANSVLVVYPAVGGAAPMANRYSRSQTTPISDYQIWMTLLKSWLENSAPSLQRGIREKRNSGSNSIGKQFTKIYFAELRNR